MALWILVALSLVNALHGLSRFSEPDFEAINFAKAIEGRKLTGRIIKEVEVASENSCQFECIKDTRCLSYNLISTSGKNTKKCQLSDSDRFVGHGNFTSEDGAMYRGIQVKLSDRIVWIEIFVFTQFFKK